MTAQTELFSIEAEQAVLGVLLLSDAPMYALAIEEGLLAEHFHRPSHRVIWAAMADLFDAGEPVTRVGVVELLRSRGELEQAGGEVAFDALGGPVAQAANVRQFARIIRSHALVRGLQAATVEIQHAITENREDPDALVAMAETRVLEVAGVERRRQTRPIGELLAEETDRLHAIATGGAELLGVPSGWRDLDAITGGFQGGNLIVIGARPSMGKSCLVTNIAEHVALSDRPVVLFSLEMGESEISQRMIASQARIKGNDLRFGRVNPERWSEVLRVSNRLAGTPLFVDDASDQGVTDLRAKARRLHQKTGGLGLVIVDYLQLLRGNPRMDSRVQQVGEMSRGLKILARELNVPVIALSQLSRAVEQRTDKRPILSDLRDSGNVEQDADLVMFLYRDEYYDRDSEKQGIAELIVAKHRNGGLGTVELAFLAEYPKFMSVARHG